MNTTQAKARKIDRRNDILVVVALVALLVLAIAGVLALTTLFNPLVVVSVGAALISFAIYKTVNFFSDSRITANA